MRNKFSPPRSNRLHNASSASLFPFFFHFFCPGTIMQCVFILNRSRVANFSTEEVPSPRSCCRCKATAGWVATSACTKKLARNPVNIISAPIYKSLRIEQVRILSVRRPQTWFQSPKGAAAQGDGAPRQVLGWTARWSIPNVPEDYVRFELRSIEFGNRLCRAILRERLKNWEMGSGRRQFWEDGHLLV